MIACATPEGTARLAERHVRAGRRPDAYRPLGRTGLAVSCVGFGGYRVAEGVEEHAAALRLALDRGVNLIDTSTNYGDGASESLVGRIVAEEGRARDELVVVSKAGFVQGSNLEDARTRAAEGRPIPELVEFSEGCWHCLHPDFLAEQLEASLARLGLERLDLYLLHDPEYFLSDARRREPDVPMEEHRTVLDERLGRAFSFLEEAAGAGKLSWYGLSSNTIGGLPDAPEGLSVRHLARLAGDASRAAGTDASRFAVVEMPFNLLEAGPVLHRGGEGDETSTAVDAAREAGLGVLANRPLNAFSGGRLVRLAEVEPPGDGPDPAEAAIPVVELEDRFRERIAPSLEALPGAGSAHGLFIWGHELLESAGRFAGLEHWRQAAEMMIRPRLQHALQHVELHLAGGARVEWESWAAEYEPAVCRLLESIDARYRTTARTRNEGLASALDPLLPEELRAESLSRKALAVAAGAPGISSVLVGMRREAYVDDAAGLLDRPLPLTDAEFLGRFAAALTSEGAGAG